MVEAYMKERMGGIKAAKDGKPRVTPELVAFYDPKASVNIKGVFSTEHHKGVKEIKEYLAEPVSIRNSDKTNFRGEVGKGGGGTQNIIVFQEAHKYGSWWDVKVEFFFNSACKISSIWIGKAWVLLKRGDVLQCDLGTNIKKTCLM